MTDILKKVVEGTGENNVTISFNTHRILPDYKKDALALKNKIREAEEMLQTKLPGEKELIETIIGSLNKLAEGIDHSYNKESMVVFVNENVAEYVRLPVSVEEKVAVGSSFVIRDAMRAMFEDSSYYIFILNLKEIHLIEAFNDRPVKIFGEPFPIFAADDNVGKGNNRNVRDAHKYTNIKSNFLNDADKILNEVIGGDNLPVIACAEESTYYEYYKVADRKDRLIGCFSFNYRNIKNIDLHIAEAAWPFVQEYNRKKNEERIAELNEAVDQGMYKTDINEIKQNIDWGMGRTLFVRKKYFLPVVIEDGVLIPIHSDDRARVGVIDDIISEFILNITLSGGDVVFLPDDELSAYNGLVLTVKS